MKRAVLSFVVAMLIFTSSAFAQNSNISPVPDLSSSDWALLGVKDDVIVVMENGRRVFSLSVQLGSYSKIDNSVQALVLLLNNQPVAMLYGSDLDDPSLVRVALKVDGKWYGAKNTGHDALNTQVIGDQTTMKAQVILTLNTGEGVKRLVVPDVPMIP